MPPTLLRAIAFGQLSLTLLLACGGAALLVLRGASPFDGDWPIVAFLGFSAVGALLLLRVPTHPVGWICAAVGPLFTTAFFAAQYAIHALEVHPGSLPWASAAAFLATGWTAVLAWGAMATLLLQVFPTGRPLWRPLLWTTTGMLATFALTVGLQPGASHPDHPRVVNPLGLDVPWLERLANPLHLVMLVIVAASVATVLARFLRSRGIERQQLKWFAGAAALLPLAYVINLALIPPEPPWSSAARTVTWTLASSSLPVAIGIAVLRYRLYDIDRIVGRALVWALLTATLGGVYLGAVLLLQPLVVAAGGAESELAVVVSTLLAASLFAPLRRRFQAWIDRAFYRRSYDARHTLEHLGATLRAEVGLDGLAHAMIRSIDAALHPSHASLWLREDRR